MAEILTAVLIATVLFLLAVNGFIIAARITGHERLAREVARALSPYMWLLRLGGENGQSVHRRSHA